MLASEGCGEVGLVIKNKESQLTMYKTRSSLDTQRGQK